MKKLFLILMGTALFLTATAQDYQKNILSVRAGVNLATLRTTGSGSSENSSTRIGYQVGISDQILITRSIPLYLETGLYASSRGGKEEGVTANPLYLQIPVLFNYHFNLGKEFSIQPFAGAYYGFAVAGKLKTNSGEKLNMFGDKGGFKRSDLGIRLGVGFEWKHYYLGANYDLGMMNNIKKDLTDNADLDLTNMKMKNNCITITLGYRF